MQAVFTWPGRRGASQTATVPPIMCHTSRDGPDTRLKKLSIVFSTGLADMARHERKGPRAGARPKQGRARGADPFARCPRCRAKCMRSERGGACEPTNHVPQTTFHEPRSRAQRKGTAASCANETRDGPPGQFVFLANWISGLLLIGSQSSSTPAVHCAQVPGPYRQYRVLSSPGPRASGARHGRTHPQGRPRGGT